MNTSKRVVTAVLFSFGAVFTLTACGGYEKGEIIEVEVAEGEHGPIKELEVAKGSGMNPDTFEAHVPENSPCDKGDKYPDCKK